MDEDQCKARERQFATLHDKVQKGFQPVLLKKLRTMEDRNEKTSAQRLAKPRGTNRECGLFVK